MVRLAFLFVLGLAVASTNAMPAFSQPRNVGSAISIVREVVQTDLVAGGAQRLSPGDAILYGNRLSAGVNSRGEFELEDETKLVLSANSSMTIDDLVLSSNDTFSTVSLKAISGAFRFISGKSPSAAYRITSAVATLGIRGTAFDVYLGAGDRFAVILLSGRLRLCDPRDPNATART